MSGLFKSKVKEALFSVLPLSLIVILLDFTPIVDFSKRELLLFSVCAVVLILGIALFSLGADLAMTPMGEHVGAGLTKSARLGLLLSVCFFLGLLITVAEPDLTVLAEQVSAVIHPTLLTVAVGVGVGVPAGVGLGDPGTGVTFTNRGARVGAGVGTDTVRGSTGRPGSWMSRASRRRTSSPSPFRA